MAENNAVHDLAREIARRLGTDWMMTGEDRTWPQIVNTKDGRQIWLNKDHKDKVNISGTWPTYQTTERGTTYTNTVTPRDVREESPSIGVSLSRPVDAIMKDIARRFLPEYDRVWLKCKESCDKWTAYHKRKRENWQRVCEAIGKWGKANDSDKNQSDYFDGVHGGYNRVEMRNEDFVKIEVELPIDAALGFFEAYAVKAAPKVQKKVSVDPATECWSSDEKGE